MKIIKMRWWIDRGFTTGPTGEASGAPPDLLAGIIIM